MTGPANMPRCQYGCGEPAKSSDGHGGWWCGRICWREAGDTAPEWKALGMNDQCPCKSGRKFKHCHWPKVRHIRVSRADLLKRLAQQRARMMSENVVPAP